MDKRYTLPDLPYDYAGLEPHYSARLLKLHHDKHHAAYVAGANTTLEKLADARERGDFAAINQLQKNFAFHLSGHVLHSLFWRNMSPHGGGEPDRELSRSRSARSPTSRPSSTRPHSTSKGRDGARSRGSRSASGS
jgi:superoxide dismutase